MIRWKRRCSWYRKQISLRNDGLLSVREASELDAHVLHCESCRVAEDLTRMLSSHMASAPDVEVSQDFDERVIFALEGPRRVTVWPQLREFTLGAAVAALFVGLAIQYAAREEAIVRAPASSSSSAKLPDGLLAPILENRNSRFWHLENDGRTTKPRTGVNRDKS